jgi:surface-anchored protein
VRARLGWAAAAACVIAPGPLCAAPVAATSGVHTVRFGVEALWPDSTALDGLHADLVVYYCGGIGEPQWRTDTPAMTYALREAHGYVNESCRETMTTSLLAEFGFIGAAAGETFWYLNQSQIAGQLYLGLRATGAEQDRLVAWHPQDPDHHGDRLDTYLRVELVDVRGPPGGHFSLFQFGASGPIVYLASAPGGNGSAAYFYSSPGGHDHYNWAFTQPGLYEIDIRLSTRVEWDPATAAASVQRHERTGADLVTEWTCDPCARYRLEAMHPASPASEWVGIGPEEGWSSRTGTLAVTNAIPDAGSQWWRVLAAP